MKTIRTCMVGLILLAFVAVGIIHYVPEAEATTPTYSLSLQLWDANENVFSQTQITVRNLGTQEEITATTDNNGEVYLDENDFSQGINNNDECELSFVGIDEYYYLWKITNFCNIYIYNGYFEFDVNYEILLPRSLNSNLYLGEHELEIGTNSNSKTYMTHTTKATILNGDYYETVNINRSYLNIRGNGTENTHLYTSVEGAFDPSYFIDGGYSFHINGSYIKISNLSIHLLYNNNTGIRINNGSNYSIDNISTIFNDVHQIGCILIEPSNISIKHSKFLNTAGNYRSIGVYVFGGYIYNYSINNCIFNITGDTSIGIGGQFPNGCSIHDNEFHMIADDCQSMVIYKSRNVLIFNNSIIINDYNMKNNGIVIFRSDNISISNNKLVSHNPKTIGMKVQASDNITFRNNYLDNTSVGDILFDVYYSTMKVEDSTLESSFTYDIQSDNEVMIEWINSGDPSVTGFSISYDADLHVINTYDLQFIDEYSDPIEDLDLKILENGSPKYQTTHYGGSDDRSDIQGLIKPIDLLVKKYHNSNNPSISSNRVLSYYNGNEYSNRIGNEKITSPTQIQLNIHHPMAPVDVNIHPVNGTQDLNISWEDENPDTQEYEIYSNSSGTWRRISATADKYYIDSGLDENEVRYYKVRSFDGFWWSDFSDETPGMSLDQTPPLPPGQPVSTRVYPDRIEFEWEPSSSNDVVEYGILVNGTGLFGDMEERFRVPSIQTNTSISRLVSDTLYKLALIAYDESGNPSAMSGISHIRTKRWNGSIDLNIDMDGIHPLRNGVFIQVTDEDEDSTLIGTSTLSSSLFIPDVPLFSTISILLEPVGSDLGEIDVRSGYLTLRIENIILEEEYLFKPKNIVAELEYYDYKEPIIGSIRGKITYLDSNGISISLTDVDVKLTEIESDLEWTTRTDTSGEFLIHDIPVPSNYTLNIIIPESDLAIIGERSGILQPDHIRITLSEDDPALLNDIILDYYYYVPYKPPIEIIEYGPRGVNAEKDSIIWIKFNNSIDVENIEDIMTAGPGITIVSFKLMEENSNLSVVVKGLEYGGSYNIRIEKGLMYGDLEYDFNGFSWHFEVKDEPETVNNGPNVFLIIIMIIVVVALISAALLLVFLKMKANQKYDESEIPKEQQFNPIPTGTEPQYPQNGLEENHIGVKRQ